MVVLAGANCHDAGARPFGERGRRDCRTRGSFGSPYREPYEHAVVADHLRGGYRADLLRPVHHAEAEAQISIMSHRTSRRL